MGEKSGEHDIEHGTSTAVYPEVDHCLQDVNLILQHGLPAEIDLVSHLDFRHLLIKEVTDYQSQIPTNFTQ